MQLNIYLEQTRGAFVIDLDVPNRSGQVPT